MKAKQFLAVLALLIGAPYIANAQAVKATLSASDTGACTTVGACLVVGVAYPAGSKNPAVGAMAFAILANASGNTITFEATVDPAGINAASTSWSTLSVTPSNSTTTVTTSAATTVTTWRAAVSGYTAVRMRMSTFVGTTTVVSINASTMAASLGGGGGAGTVTNVSGTANQIDVATGTTTPVVSIDAALQLPGTLSTAFQIASSNTSTASTPAFVMTGTPFTGGTSSTTTPHFWMHAGAGTPTFPTVGTMFGIQLPSASTADFACFTGNTGGCLFTIDSSGNVSTFSGNGTYGGSVTGSSGVSGAKYSTSTNCSSSASPAVCGSAVAGSIAVPTGTNATLVVDTTAVTANSQIFVQSDDTLGTKLSVTCNSTLASLIVEPVVSARTAGTSFTVTISGTTTTNPVCLSYFIVN